MLQLYIPTGGLKKSNNNVTWQPYRPIAAKPEAGKQVSSTSSPPVTTVATSKSSPKMTSAQPKTNPAVLRDHVIASIIEDTCPTVAKSTSSQVTLHKAPESTPLVIPPRGEKGCLQTVPIAQLTKSEGAWAPSKPPPPVLVPMEGGGRGSNHTLPTIIQR